MAVLPDIFAKIATIADRVGVADVAEAARTCATLGRPERVLVVNWPSTPSATLCDWLGREVPSISVASAAADSPSVRWPAATADRVLALIPIGEFLDAVQCEQLQELVLTRPSGTFQIVLTATQSVDPKTFTRSEAGLKHLLQPSNKGGFSSNNATLEEFLFWMQDHAESSLAARLDRDRLTLLTWLRQPLPDKVRDSLVKFQALEMIESLDQKAEPPAELSTPDRQRITTLREQLRLCRRRILEILERGLVSVQRELTTSLSTLERDLVQDVRTKLRESLQEKQLHEMVLDTIRGKLLAWEESMRSMLASRKEELARDTEVLVQGNDWQLLNELYARRGLVEQFPRDLLENLRIPEESIQRLIVLPGEVVLPDGWGARIRRDLSAAPASLIGALCGGVIAAFSAVWFFGPKGALLGAGLGAAGGAYAGRQLMAPDAIRALWEVEQKIVETVQQAIEAINRFTSEAASQLRTPIEARFERIEEILIEASSSGDRPHRTPARDEAQELRKEILAGNVDSWR